MAQQIKVYSTFSCPWCKKVKQFLDDNKITYQNVDVANDKNGREEMINKTGQLAVPVIDIDGDIKVGYDENWLKQNLNIS